MHRIESRLLPAPIDDARLARLVELTRRIADALGRGDHGLAPLLEEFSRRRPADAQKRRRLPLIFSGNALEAGDRFLLPVMGSLIAHGCDASVVREANSAGGVDEPEQPVSSSIGRYQLGTRPVASHCASERIECDVSIRESHCGASAVPSADDAPKVAAYFFM